MSVIVKGMEMPKNCFSCACASYYERLDKAMCDPTNKQLDQKVWKKERHPNCPLVDIPTPHGRLIDADKLKSRLVLDNDSNELQRISADILKWIDIQETVIEGSEA